jgi:hypothetical protein
MGTCMSADEQRPRRRRSKQQRGRRQRSEGTRSQAFSSFDAQPSPEAFDPENASRRAGATLTLEYLVSVEGVLQNPLETSVAAWAAATETVDAPSVTPENHRSATSPTIMPATHIHVCSQPDCSAESNTNRNCSTSEGELGQSLRTSMSRNPNSSFAAADDRGRFDSFSNVFVGDVEQSQQRPSNARRLSGSQDDDYGGRRVLAKRTLRR